MKWANKTDKNETKQANKQKKKKDKRKLTEYIFHQHTYPIKMAKGSSQNRK